MDLSPTASHEEKVEHYCAVARGYVDAVNRKDLETILSYYADDAEIHEPFGKAPLKGKEALREFYTHVIARAHMEITGPIRSSFGNAVAVPLRARIPGKEIDVITVTKFNEEGLVLEYFAFWGLNNLRSVEA